MQKRTWNLLLLGLALTASCTGAEDRHRGAETPHDEYVGLLGGTSSGQAAPASAVTSASVTSSSTGDASSGSQGASTSSGELSSSSSQEASTAASSSSGALSASTSSVTGTTSVSSGSATLSSSATTSTSVGVSSSSSSGAFECPGREVTVHTGADELYLVDAITMGSDLLLAMAQPVPAGEAEYRNAVTLKKLGDEGELQGASTLTTTAAILPRIAKNDSAALVVWGELDEDESGVLRNEIYARVVDASGNPTGAVLHLSDSPQSHVDPSVVWNAVHEEWAVIWPAFGAMGNTLYFARIGGDGSLLSTGARTIQGWPGIPVLASAGSGYLALWATYTDGFPQTVLLTLDALDRFGTPGNSTTLTSTRAENLGLYDLVWTGTQAGVVWSEDKTTATGLFLGREIHFEHRWPDGQPASESQVIATTTPQFGLSVRWNGEDYALAWSEGGEESAQVRWLTLNADGTPRGEVADVSCQATPGAYWPRLTWDGQGWVALWTERPEMTLPVTRVARLGP